MDKFIDFLSDKLFLNENEKEELRNNLKVVHFDKNDYLLKSGAISKSFYFLMEGAVRLYYSVEGEEKSAFFYTENKFVSSFESFSKQIPSTQNFHCMEDCTLVEITAKAAFKLKQSNPKFSALAVMMMEEEMVIYQDIISSFVCLNAEQRYLKLLEANDVLFQRFPQHQIASFLGIKPETLSRIRKKLTLHKLN